MLCILSIFHWQIAVIPETFPHVNLLLRPAESARITNPFARAGLFLSDSLANRSQANAQNLRRIVLL